MEGVEFLSIVFISPDIYATSFPGSSPYLEKVPWLRLVTCLCMLTQAARRVGSQLNFVNTLWGGDCCAATLTLFCKESKLFVGDPAWPVLRLYLNFYEYEMLIDISLLS